MLLPEHEPESYAPAARRLLARLAGERVPALEELVGVAAILVALERDPAFTARRKLLQLIREAPRT